ncbi:MAG: hypothetical protein K2X01_11140 [Cyanobacteria bacterium]|nr:hypothetical protein [Cyanobacteriota bacterium]
MKIQQQRVPLYRAFGEQPKQESKRRLSAGPAFGNQDVKPAKTLVLTALAEEDRQELLALRKRNRRAWPEAMTFSALIVSIFGLFGSYFGINAYQQGQAVHEKAKAQANERLINNVLAMHPDADITIEPDGRVTVTTHPAPTAPKSGN